MILPLHFGLGHRGRPYLLKQNKTKKTSSHSELSEAALDREFPTSAGKQAQPRKQFVMIQACMASWLK